MYSRRRKMSWKHSWQFQCLFAEPNGSCFRCEALAPQISRHWQDLLSIRQILHNLPMKLHVSVSLVEAEHTQSCLQDDYYGIESRFAALLESLRHQATLWTSFQNNVDAVHNTMEQTDFMMELLQVHGDVDEKRLTMATQRLEVRTTICLFLIMIN